MIMARTYGWLIASASPILSLSQVLIIVISLFVFDSLLYS